MANEQQGFLDDILANPDDDTPPLVYADWLDEQGSEMQQAQAGLIRIECKMESMDPETVPRTLRDERRLFAERYWDAMRAAMPWVENQGSRRGLLESATINAAKLGTEFRGRMENTLSQLPLRELKLCYMDDPQTEFLLDLPAVRHLRRLRIEIGTYWGQTVFSSMRSIEKLSSCAHLENLRLLQISSSSSAFRMGDGGVELLASSPHMKMLEDLDISGNGIGNPGMEHLAAAANWGRLARIDLGINEMDEDGMFTLLTSDRLRALRRVEVFEPEFPVEALLAQLAAAGVPYELEGETAGENGDEQNPATFRTNNIAVQLSFFGGG